MAWFDKDLENTEAFERGRREGRSSDVISEVFDAIGDAAAGLVPATDEFKAHEAGKRKGREERYQRDDVIETERTASPQASGASSGGWDFDPSTVRADSRRSTAPEPEERSVGSVMGTIVGVGICVLAGALIIGAIANA